MTNYFTKLIENELMPEPEEEKIRSTVTFELSLPISNYKSKGDNAATYAARDVVSPVLVAQEKILKTIGLKSLPLNISIKAFMKQQTNTETTFEVFVEGGDKNFLISLLDLM